MRYFRYKNTHKNVNNALKEQYKTLTEDEKRIFRKKNSWEKFSTIVALTIFTCCMIAEIFLLKSIPVPNDKFLEALVIVIKVIVGLVFVICQWWFNSYIGNSFVEKVETFDIPLMKKEIFSKACKHLRVYYQLQEPYIITKCFEATDKNFQNHDVCIFVVGDELRITTDLIRGFLHGERDLGCYAFKKEEITLLKRNNGNHLVAELRTDNTVFMLGYRAKGFIDNFLISKTVR